MRIQETFFKGAVLLLSGLLLSYGLLMWPRKMASQQADLKLYYSVSAQLFAGKIPYRDFSVEYPPLALLPLLIPRLVSFGAPLDYGHYILLYTLESLFWAIVLGFALLKLAKYWPKPVSSWRLLAVYLALLLLTRDFVLWRYDLFPALLTALALLAVLQKQPVLVGVWLGLAVLAKLYPVILGPIFLLYYLMSRQYRASIGLLVGAGLAAVVILTPVFITSGDQVLSFLTYHQQRGLQLESLASGLILLVHLPDLSNVRTEFNFGAFHLVAAGVGPVLKALPVLFLAGFGALMALCGFRFRREFGQTGAVSGASLLTFLLAALAVFILTNKVFSPQYLIWLLPFVLFLRNGQIATMIVIFILTTLVYPVFYGSLIEPKPIGVLLLNARNLLMLGWFAFLLGKPSPITSQQQGSTLINN